MKTVLFMTTIMGNGGVERALLNLLDYFPKDKYLVDVLLVEKSGAFLPQLENKVSVIQLPIAQSDVDSLRRMTGKKKLLKRRLKQDGLFATLNTIKRMVITEDPFYFLRTDFDKIPSFDKHYDIAVCFHIHFPFNLAYIACKVVARKKYAWIHNDFSSTGFDIQRYSSYLENYSFFFSVSEKVRKEFVQIFPYYERKSFVFPNDLGIENIRSQSREYYPTEYVGEDGIRLLSIGRFTTQKGFDIIPPIAKRLHDEGVDFVWYILGDGSEKENIKKQIQIYNVEEQVRLIPSINNPYPYIKHCDIYIQPSRHEGYGLCVAEARILEKPIICTNFAGAHEQLRNNVTGIIVEFNEEELFDAVLMLCNSSNERDSFTKQLEIENKENHSVTDKLVEKYF